MSIMKKKSCSETVLFADFFLCPSLLSASGIGAHGFHALLTAKELLLSYRSIKKMNDVLWTLALSLKQRRRKWKPSHPWEGDVYALRVYSNLGKSDLFRYIQGTIGQSC